MTVQVCKVIYGGWAEKLLAREGRSQDEELQKVSRDDVKNTSPHTPGDAIIIIFSFNIQSDTPQNVDK